MPARRFGTNGGATVRATSLLFLLALAGIPGPAPATASAAAASDEPAVLFEANLGQAPPDVLFLGRSRDVAVGVLADGLEIAAGDWSPVRMRLDGSLGGHGEGGPRVPGVVHYMLGEDPAGWVRDVPRHTSVRVVDVYPGVDLAVYGNADGELEYDFEVAPLADASRIRLAFDGASPALGPGGGLELGPGLVQRAPVAWQDDGTPVASRYVVAPDGRVSFALGPRDERRALTIDPILASSTYLGGSGDDAALAVAVGPDGHTHVAGSTSSTNFPAFAARQPAAGGQGDAFVAKYALDGRSILWATYLGGSAADSATALSVGADGTVFVVGATSSPNFPVASALQATKRAGPGDAFALRLSADGASLVWSTYLGGSNAGGSQTGTDAATGVALAPSGDVVVVGRTDASDFPLASPRQPAPGGATDAFVARIAADGSALRWSTYLGGAGADVAHAVAIGGDGRAIVVGETSSPFFPLLHAWNVTYGGLGDAFVAKFADDGALLFSTFLGGSKVDVAYAVASDASGFAHVAGRTWSPDFPLEGSLMGWEKHEEEEEEEEEEHAHGNKADAFVSTFTPDGSALEFSTYLGGSGLEEAYGIAVAPDGALHVAGRTESTDFPVVSAVQSAKADGSLFVFDAFFAKLAPDRTLAWSSYLGGASGTSSAAALALDAAGHARIVGQTASPVFPTRRAADASWNGAFDAFVAVVDPAAAAPPTAPTNVRAASGSARGQLAVWWDAPADDGGAFVSGYRVYAGSSPSSLTFRANTTARSFTETGLGDGATRYYSVRAVNSAGDGVASAIVSGTTTLRPGPPRNFEGEAGPGLAQVTLRWDAPDGTAPVAQYRLYRALAGSADFSLVKTVGGSVRTTTDAPPVPALEYVYRLAAWSTAGESDRSNAVTVRALALPVP